MIETGKTNIWPVSDTLDQYSEDDFFDIIELLFEYISKPTACEYHGWNDCCCHYSEFDRGSGRVEFRNRINKILQLYNKGYELSEEGEIQRLPATGMETLDAATLPAIDDENVTTRVEAARKKYFRRGSSFESRRDAIRNLVDVLEFLRPKLKGVITAKDENDLFNIVNNFGIRHHNEKQKTDYDEAVWQSWMYYYYLAMIHAVVRLIEKWER